MCLAQNGWQGFANYSKQISMFPALPVSFSAVIGVARAGKSSKNISSSSGIMRSLFTAPGSPALMARRSRFAVTEPTTAKPSSRRIPLAPKASRRSKLIGGSSTTTAPQDQRRNHRGHQHAGNATLGICLGDPASWRSSWRASGNDAIADENRQCRAIRRQAVIPRVAFKKFSSLRRLETAVQHTVLG